MRAAGGSVGRLAVIIVAAVGCRRPQAGTAGQTPLKPAKEAVVGVGLELPLTERRQYGVADLDWIAWAPPYSELPPNPQLAAVIPDFQPVFSSNDYLVQIAAVHAGDVARFRDVAEAIARQLGRRG